MEPSALKRELVNIIAEILFEAADRLGDRLEERLRSILRDPVKAKMPESAHMPTIASSPSRFMDLRQFGAYFSMKPTAAYKMLQREKPPAGVVVRLGMRRIRVDIPAFEKWLASKAK
jgi:hypothetical protein